MAVFRILFAAISCLALVLRPAVASDETVYFVSLAEISQEQQEKYDSFIESVVPIWSRHGMEVISRATVIDALGEQAEAFNEVAVIRAKSRSGFNAYLADPEYKAIKQSRLDAVTRFIVLEGRLETSRRLEFLETLPMVTLAMSADHNGFNRDAASLALRIDLVAPVKGAASEFVKKIKSVELTGLSFDDNPAQFLPPGGMTLIGEVLR